MNVKSLKQLTCAQKFVLITSFLTLTLGLGNLIRAVEAARYANLLPNLPMAVPWAYLITLGGFWGLVFLACTGGLALFRRWGRLLTLAAVTLYQAHVWINHLLFESNDYARQTSLRDALLTLLLLAWTWVGLNWKSVRKTFKQ